MAEKVGGIYYEVSADTKPLIDQARVVDRETQRMAASFNVITAAIKVLAVAMALIKSAQLADEMRLLAARVEVAAGSVDKATAAMRELQSISLRTQTAVAANVQVFTRLNQSLLQMGGTQADTLRLTELLGMAIKVSGASATESASAMLQFGQALGSGKLAGDELRSLLENAPYLMRQLADGLGVPIGALKKLGEDGKLTADVVVNAMQKAASQIERDFAKMPMTLSAAFQVAQDALQRLVGATDEASGKSAALTGITKGLGEAMDALAGQIRNADGAAGEMDRKDSIRLWAERTRTAVSYLLDGLDFVYQKLLLYKKPGEELIALAMKVPRAVGKAIGLGGGADTPPDIKAPTVGERMRATWADQAGASAGAADAAMRRGARRDAANTKLTPPRDAAADKKAADAAAKAADKRAKDYADSLMEQKKIEDEARELGAKFIMDEQKKKEKADEDRKRAQAIAADAVAGDDPVLRLQLEYQRKQEVLQEALAAELLTRQEYAAATLQLEQTKADRLTEIRQREIDQQNANNQASLSMAAGLAGDLFSLLEKSGRDRSALAKALFLTSKALAVAEIILNTEVAAAKAGAQLGIFGIPIATMIRATGYASAAMVGGMAIGQLAGGRQYGGPTSAGSLYRVNETGRPEMFTAANGSQYMMPTQSGRVTAADKVGGGATVLELRVINQMPGAQVTQRTGTDGRPEIVIAEIADQISSRRGPVWAALGTTNVRGRI